MSPAKKKSGNGNGNGKKNQKNQNSFEWYQKDFKESCELCGEPIIMHCVSPGGVVKYACCTKEDCGKRGKEVGHREAFEGMRKCARCGEDLVECGRRKKSTKHREAVYMYCNFRGDIDEGGERTICNQYLKEICFLGEISVKQKPTYPEKQVITKQIVHWPKVVYSS